MSLEIGLNENKKSLFIVESSFQLLGALEAIESFNLQEYLLAIRYSRESNNKQMDLILKLFKIPQKNIKYISITYPLTIKSSYSLVAFVFWLQKNKNRYTNIFLGDYNSGILTKLRKALLEKKEIFYLDDGVATLNIQKQFTDDHAYNLFTMYTLNAYNNQKVIQHDFAYLKKQLALHILEQGSFILLLGNKFYEEGLVSKEYFFRSLDQLLGHYPDKNIRYVAHRDEGLDKLDYLREHYGFEVVQYSYPIELYGFYEKKMPEEIVSFLSTALLTMKVIYDDVKVKAYKIDIDELLDRKEGFETVYKIYESYLEVKEL